MSNACVPPPRSSPAPLLDPLLVSKPRKRQHNLARSFRLGRTSGTNKTHLISLYLVHGRSQNQPGLEKIHRHRASSVIAYCDRTTADAALSISSMSTDEEDSPIAQISLADVFFSC
ncbi:hypothetical protein C8J57DRAFT_1530225 [Mycena rebaudengoi]|nr:hypothetical protein C8J57DRAFT_1530225 [Mycena rebaudengoi]